MFGRLKCRVSPPQESSTLPLGENILRLMFYTGSQTSTEELRSRYIHNGNFLINIYIQWNRTTQEVS